MESSYRFTQKLSAYQQKYKTTLYGSVVTFNELKESGAQQIRDLRDEARAEYKKLDRQADTMAVAGSVVTIACGSLIDVNAAWISGIVFASALAPLCVRSDIQDRRARKLDLAHALVTERLADVEFYQTVSTLLRRKVIEKKPAQDRMEKLNWYTPPV